MRFHDRNDAGRQLGQRLARYAGRSDVIVLALPRGGVPVAHEVARHLHAPLDVFLVRKLGVPGHPELAVGAIAEGGIEVLSDDFIRDLGIPQRLVQQVAVRERIELDSARRALSWWTPAARGARSHRDSRRRRPRNRIDDAGGGDGAAAPRAGAHCRRRAGRRP
jgi:predicted phosphoribosyltransferase